MKRGVRFLSTAMCLMLASSCTGSEWYEPGDPVDPSGRLTREDYRDIYNLEKDKAEGKAAPKSGNVVEPPIPDLADILALPKPPQLGETKLVSVAVTDDVPLKDVLIELARLADVDIEVDAGIAGGIGFRAKDRPFNEVIDRICDMAGLRYTMKDNVLRVERDLPYLNMYSLDFLNINRSATSSINISTNVLSSSGTGSSSGGSSGSGGLNSGSSTSITSTASNDFWEQFEATLSELLSYSPASRASSATISSQGEPADAAAGAAGQPRWRLNTSSTGSAAPAASGGANSFYILNRQASTLTVSATKAQHKLIDQFVSKIRENISAQVLIEAKIVEVTLNDQYQSGIDWSQLGNDKISFPFAFNGATASGSLTGPINTTNVATFNLTQNDLIADINLDVAVSLAELFGSTRTLSSPRLHAANNQTAVLTFAQNQVYFTLDVTQQTNSNAGGTTTEVQVNSEVHTVPIGIIMTLQPSINTDTNEITLNVRPTLSRVTGQVPDPAVAFLLTQLDDDADTSGLESNIPVVQVREMDSILKLKSGQVMVIGGLMSDDSSSTDQGVPGVSGVPWLGNLFKATNKAHGVSELVIFIRATIVGSHGNADHADKTVYEKFTRDPRPLDF